MFALTKTQNNNLLKAATLVGCVLFLVVCTKFRIYTQFSPVPITMQTFSIFILGALLPFRQSVTCFMVVLLERFFGSPFIGMPIAFTGLTFGYLVGMVVALYFLSKAIKKMPLMLALVVADVLILAFGALHLQFVFGFKVAFMVGVVPFIVGGVLKILAAYGFIQATLKKRLDSTSV